ncbi:hypothetical protein [Streptomyces sp. CA2R101]|uniref:hypothetical protein n=1 Tax=Streptomyces sp. CA2R101 TaxID=3120152 RepID=UPI00300A7AAE
MRHRTLCTSHLTRVAMSTYSPLPGEPMHHDPSWEPLPVRGTFRLTCQFLLTIVYAPVHWILCTALSLALIALGFALELVSWLPGVETGYKKLFDIVFAVFPWSPRWFVTLPELRHEGDTAFYQARVEAALSRWSDNWKWPHTTLPVRTYRAVGAAYVAQRAGEFGWRLQDPADQRPLSVVKLSRITPVRAGS